MCGLGLLGMPVDVELLMMPGTLERTQPGGDGVVAPRLDTDVVGRVCVDQVDLGAELSLQSWHRIPELQGKAARTFTVVLS